MKTPASFASEHRSEERGSGFERASARYGQTLGNSYRLLERIGAGGAGDVYEAEHLRLGRRVAIKILRSNRSLAAVQRFWREVEATACIASEYVVNVFDSGEAQDGAPYLAMELLRGEDLQTLLESASPLPIPRAVRLVWEACQGVAAAHEAGLVHRDLKPANLYVTKRATGEDWCKVLDFGVAKLALSELTADGALIGTVRYMAPEQLQDGAAVGPAVDVYALGAILYECLCGESPHSGTTVQELMFKIMNEAPQPIAQRRRGVPPPLAQAIGRALHKSPAQRFQDASALARALVPFGKVDLPRDSTSQSETVEVEGFDGGSVRASGRNVVLSFAGGVLVGGTAIALVGWSAVGVGAAGALATPLRTSASSHQTAALVTSPQPILSAGSPTVRRTDATSPSPSARRPRIEPSGSAHLAAVPKPSPKVEQPNLLEGPRAAPRQDVSPRASLWSPDRELLDEQK